MTINKKIFKVEIKDADGAVIYKNDRVEAPDTWGQNSVNITASKFFHSNESSVFDLVNRVVDKIYIEGEARGYSVTPAWADKLRALCLEQRAAYNSPVWFNIGVPNRPQRASACFILSVKDDMDSILELQRAEATIFKYGGGAGSNLSALRSSYEYVGQTGSRSSGPLGFMHGYDSWAGVIKSGSKARRAAKMTVLDVEHPDLLKFIEAKPLGEKITQALIAAGFKNDFTSDDGAQHWAPYQNANLSVRAGDNFMQAVEGDAMWSGSYVRGPMASGSVTPWTMRAREVFRKIAEAAWRCGDPGMQFSSTINAWNCVPGMGSIKASNPCSEFVFPDDSACNLASLNLLKFRKPDGSFDYDAFGEAIDILIVAMDILCGFADYPTKAIRENSLKYRPLGLGYANLGALLIANGLPYDSEEGRKLAAEITSFMTARAYLQSATIAKHAGPYAGWRENCGAHLAVLEKHASASNRMGLPFDRLWDEVFRAATVCGLRNAQMTLLAPTGTIGFMMGCDAFGIEPLDCIAKTKKLVGGGQMAIVADVVEDGLRHLGYDGAGEAWDAHGVFERLKSGRSFESAGILEEHWPIFATSYGELPISPQGHLKMMAAVQPFLSGAISKTVALPRGSTVEDVERTYMDAWKMGIKCIALYVDGSKSSQPIEPVREKRKSREEEEREEELSARGWTRPIPAPIGEARKLGPLDVTPSVREWCLEIAKANGWGPVTSLTPSRKRLPDERQAITHKFNVGGHEGYMTVGLYENGQPGEIFVKMAKEGSLVSGFVDAFATSISMLLQYGVPLEQLAAKFKGGRFAPEGFTTNPEIRQASSVLDYIFRWMEGKFVERVERVETSDLAGKIRALETVTAAAEMMGQGMDPADVAGVLKAPSPEQEIGGYSARDAVASQINIESDVVSWDQGTLENPVQPNVSYTHASTRLADLSNPPCTSCGGPTRKSGSCFTCENCGGSSGCA